MYKTVLAIASISSFQTFAFCFDEAGKDFDINPNLIKAICYTESTFRPSVINGNNADGSADYGLCQINSWWLKRLNPMGITKETLIDEPCENVKVAAWILNQNFETSGKNWRSVGEYNTGYDKSKVKARERYIETVQHNLEAISNGDI